MLAGIEEQLQEEHCDEIEEEMTDVETLLAGLIDYAGLYPPAGLDMRTAVANYLRYREGEYRAALGRFVVGVDRLDELRSAAGDAFAEMRLSVIVTADAAAGVLEDLLGLEHVAFECKVSKATEIEGINAVLDYAECYFEIPMVVDEELLTAVKVSQARVKLRMGGVVADAFPQAKAVAAMLHALAGRQIAFKATAGLHHPIRSRHPFTYASNSPSGTMHGFLNVAFAAAVLRFGGTAREACELLEEEEPGAWQIARDGIVCRGLRWSTEQLRTLREQFFISFGSCSLEEPIHDLEALGWL
jgi:hypothetical protein